MAYKALSAPEEVRPICDTEAVEELIVESCRPVVGFGIPNIEPSVRAATLCQRAGSKRLTKCKVRDGSHSMPVVQPQRKEGRIVVSVTKTGSGVDCCCLVTEHRLT